jgi:hypothetical protein
MEFANPRQSARIFLAPQKISENSRRLAASFLVVKKHPIGLARQQKLYGGPSLQINCYAE